VSCGQQRTVTVRERGERGRVRTAAKPLAGTR
jgi:hypothetical protein